MGAGTLILKGFLKSKRGAFIGPGNPLNSLKSQNSDLEAVNMKKVLMSVVATLALLAMTQVTFAEETKAAVKAKKYEVVDVACYTGKGESGEKHKACAVKCISGGGELALLHGGDLFVPVDKDFKSARDKFKAHAGETVEVKGKVIS